MWHKSLADYATLRADEIRRPIARQADNATSSRAGGASGADTHATF